MNKTELTDLAKSVKLPKGWKFLKAYPRHSPKYTKILSEYDSLYFGMPIDFRMEASHSAMERAIGGILKQLNKGRRGKKARKFEEFGGGFGGGKFYDVHIGIDYSDEDEAED